jgi:release factor glutamine methyltransferase
MTGEPATIGAAVTLVAARLAGLPDARREARLLTALALGVEPVAVLAYPERPLDPAIRSRLEALTERRRAGEPLSRLRGHREFWSLDFLLSPDTLDPRPDSETLVAAVLDTIPDRAAPLRLLDFGTGTGCLLLALLSELPASFGIGIDIAPGAALTARRNAAALGLSRRAAFLVGDWGESISGSADVIVANPPYIRTDDIAGLAPGVGRFDPVLALDGGPDGIAPYRILVKTAGRLLKPGGIAAFEVGAGQAERIAVLTREAGLIGPEIRCDLAGIGRCIRVWKPPCDR